jgi:NAD(P)-dependent dehydrogenase (short-subunit alcohol dehydrogenase family)
VNAGGPLVVVVTGADNGIGFHLTAALLERGHLVSALDLSTVNLAALEQRHPAGLLPVVADVTDGAATAEAVRRTLDRWGRVDVLVNNACIVGVAPFADRTIDDIRREMEVNFVGYARMMAAVLPHMTDRGAGIIHNISSVVGMTGLPRMSGYAASKAAVEGMSRSVSAELRGSGVHVTLVHLPFTATRSARRLDVSTRLMADPADIGRRLAQRISSTGLYVTPNLFTRAWLTAARWLPGPVGRVMALVSQHRSGSIRPDRPVRGRGRRRRRPPGGRSR